MSIIQLVLIAGILLIGIFWYRKLRSAKIDSLVLFFLLCTGLILIIFPDFSTRLAQYAGVGRGADLIFYLSNLIFLFLILKLYLKIRDLESVITQIIREKAITESERLKKD